MSLIKNFHRLWDKVAKEVVESGEARPPFEMPEEKDTTCDICPNFTICEQDCTLVEVTVSHDTRKHYVCRIGGICKLVAAKQRRINDLREARIILRTENLNKDLERHQKALEHAIEALEWRIEAMERGEN